MISVENHLVSHPGVFNAPTERNWVLVLGVKKSTHGATGPRNECDDIFSGVDTLHERDGQTDRQTDRQRDRQTDRHTDRHTDRQTHRQTDRHRQTERQTDRWTDRQTDRQTDRHRPTAKTTLKHKVRAASNTSLTIQLNTYHLPQYSAAAGAE